MSTDLPDPPPPDRPSTGATPAYSNDDTPRAAEVGRIPQHIGHFRIRRVIASGGMGTVYEAMQEHPRRTVAVKVMRQGLTARSALRRFEFEAQILARLRHPGIAQVFEAGTHDDGGGPVPYFAMEYVPGARPITEHVRVAQLPTDGTLELFAQVCEAVHHGHQKGIIHRDLKPGNILVDSAGHPKVIDFGVARATDHDLAVTTLQTDVGQLIGTLQYMSPEQIDADPHDLDTRTDVYSLGIVLYELLCGGPPYDLSGTAVPEAARIIRDAPPTRPGTRFPQLRGDVETIVLKALAKDRQRRYQSAAAMGQDIRRHLAGEPIEARPPTLRHQLALLARRNRAVVAAVVVGLVTLVFGLALTSWQAFRAGRAEEQAVRLAQSEADARIEAERQAAIAEAVSAFMGDMLTSLDTGQDEAIVEISRDLRVIDVLDAASRRIVGRFEQEPLVEADVRTKIGETYRSIGEFAEAERHLEVAVSLFRAELGEEARETIRAMHALGLLYYDLSEYERALSMLESTLQLRQKVVGDDDPDTLKSMNDLALVQQKLGRTDEAERLFQAALDGRRRTLRDDHPRTLVSMNNLALLQRDLGRFEDAATLLGETLALQRRVRGSRHTDTLVTMNNLALVYVKLDRNEEAERLYLEALEGQRHALGDDHARTLITLNNLGDLCIRQDRPADAETYLAEAAERATASLPEGFLTGVFLVKLGVALTMLERFDEAEEALLRGHDILRRVLEDDPDHERLRTARARLHELYTSWNRPDDAARWAEVRSSGG